MAENYTLVESLPKRLLLTPTQADQLRNLGKQLKGKDRQFDNGTDASSDDAADSDEKRVLTCQPVGGEENTYDVKALNVAGVVGLPGLDLHIQPKIPINHFAHIARYAVSRPRLSNEEVSISSLEAFWELIAAWCISAVEKIVRDGLIVDYRELSDDLSVVRGRVNVRRTAEHFLYGRLQANCTFEEFDHDNALNRVLRTAMRFIAAATWLGEGELKKRAARMNRALEGIGDLQKGDIYVQVDRRSRRYSEAIDLSLRVLGEMGADIDTGNKSGRTFLFYTPALIEQGLRKILSDSFAPLPVYKSSRLLSENPVFRVNPDLVFGNVLLTGDVKYKVAGDTWVRDDVAQATLFASAFGVQRAVIATFSKEHLGSDLELEFDSLLLKRIVWDASPNVDPLVSQADFLFRMKKFIQPVSESMFETKQLKSAC
jgi:5-methylcytosine-specific restriction enzyme subunit McrC